MYSKDIYSNNQNMFYISGLTEKRTFLNFLSQFYENVNLIVKSF